MCVVCETVMQAERLDAMATLAGPWAHRLLLGHCVCALVLGAPASLAVRTLQRACMHACMHACVHAGPHCKGLTNINIFVGIFVFGFWDPYSRG